MTIPKIIACVPLFISSFCCYAEADLPDLSSETSYLESFSTEKQDEVLKMSMNDAIELANQQLLHDEMSVSVAYTSLPNFILKATRNSGSSFLIDIITPENESKEEQGLKDPSLLANEIIQAIELQETCNKIEGILISSSGSKFDTRRLEQHTLFIDKEGYLLIDGQNILYEVPEPQILRAEQIHSYGIMRLIEEGTNVYIDIGNQRLDHIGMRIKCEETKLFEGKECYVLDTPNMTESIDALALKMDNWPKP